MNSESDRKEIVIIGGGIIGCTTAYYITRHPSFNPQKHSVTLLEASKIAGGASGKAGGLLALWAYPSNLVPLSFRLHAELAQEHDGETRWGYRRISCGEIEVNGRSSIKAHNASPSTTNGGGKESSTVHKLKSVRVPDDLDWVNANNIMAYENMGASGATAQVHPFHFTTAMASLASEAGVNIVLGARVQKIEPSATTSAKTNVTYAEKSTGMTRILAATEVVVAAGPWTKSLIPKAPISGLRAHSITIRPSRPVSGYALFTTIDLPRDLSHARKEGRVIGKGIERVTPEIYARPGNEVYVCGEGDTLVPLPESTAEVRVVDERCKDLMDYVSVVSDELRDGIVTARQACYLPVCEGGGGPWIGKTKMRGVIMAAGHSCWGIQNAPATGKVVSEIVIGGKAKCLALGALDASLLI